MGNEDCLAELTINKLHVFISPTKSMRFSPGAIPRPASTRGWPGGRLLHIHEQRGLPTPHIRRDKTELTKLGLSAGENIPVLEPLCQWGRLAPVTSSTFSQLFS